MKRNLSGSGVTIAGLLLAGGGAYAMWTGWDMILVERGWSLFIAGAVAVSGGVVTMALGRVVAHLARLSAAPAQAAVQPIPAPPPAPTMAPAEPAAPIVEQRAPAGQADDEKPTGKPAPVAKPLPARIASLAKPSAPAAAASAPGAKHEGRPSTPEAPPMRPTAAPPKLNVPSPSEPKTADRAVDRKAETPAPDFAALLNPQARYHTEPHPNPSPEPSEVDRYTAGDSTYVMMSDGSVEVHSAAGVQRYPSLAALKADTTSRQR